MANLFAAANQVMGPKPLVSFRAGKMFKEGNLVKPDKRKGLISLIHTDDMLIHFQWKDRYTGTVEEDLVIFPDEAVFTRVEKCTTGRVYMLEFKGTSRQLFYWVQEPKDDKDEENCKKLNQFMNNPPPFRGGIESGAASAGHEGSGTGTGAGGAAGMLGQLDRNQLMGLLSGFSANAGAGGQGQPSAADLAALQSMLQGFGAAAPTAGGTSATQPATVNAPATQAATLPAVNLQHVVDASEISSAVQANTEEFVTRLMEHLPPLPEGVSKEQHLLDNLRSSQLQQTISLFDSALSDPQAFSEIMASFGLQPAPDGPPFGTKAFLDAIVHSAAQNRATSQPKDEAQPMDVVKEEPNPEEEKPKDEQSKEVKEEPKSDAAKEDKMEE